jgi:Amiloride-sensitive sodium channel
VVALAGFAYQCRNVVVDYVQNPLVTELEMVHSSNIHIPDIALCSTLRLNATSMATDGNVSAGAVELIFRHFTQYESDQLSPAAKMDPATAAESLREWSGNLRDLVWRHRLDCEQIFLRCTFQYQEFDCCQRAIPTEHLSYGVCYVFRVPDTSTDMQFADDDAGYAIVMDPMPRTALGHLPPRFRPLELGATMEIYDNYNESILDPILLATNSAITVAVKMQKFERTTDKGGGCDPVLRPFWTYRGMWLKCFSDATEAVCNCSILGYTKYSSLPYCLPMEETYCERIHAVAWEKEYTECLKIAHRPMCHEWSYDLTVSSLDWDVAGVKEVMPEQYGHVDDMLRLKVHFPSLVYTRVRQIERYPLDNLLSNIGGQWGMWVGGSLISMYKLIMAGVKRWRARTSSETQSRGVDEARSSGRSDR